MDSMEVSESFMPNKINENLVFCPSRWSKKEDCKLKELKEKFQGDWEIIKCYFPSKTSLQCEQRWNNLLLNPRIVKSSWTEEEDEQLKNLVERYGPKKWTLIASHMKGRLGKQCRERWHNHVNPELKRTPWTDEEDLIVIAAHKIYGNHWSKIAKLLHGRSDNSIKNHWNSAIKKQFKLDKEGEVIQTNVSLTTETHLKAELSTLLNSSKIQGNICEENKLSDLSVFPLKFIQNDFFDNLLLNSNGNVAPVSKKFSSIPSIEDINISENVHLSMQNRTPDCTPLKIKQELGTPLTPTPFKKVLANIEKKMKNKYRFSVPSENCCEQDMTQKVEESSFSFLGKENARPKKNVRRALSFTATNMLENPNSDYITFPDELFNNNTKSCQNMGNIKLYSSKELESDIKNSKVSTDFENWAIVACGCTNDQLILTELAYSYLKKHK